MIESLTQSQINKFPEFREKWTKIGLCTEPANRKEAEKAINKSYVLIGLAPPEEIVWRGSPQSIINTVEYKPFSDIRVKDSVWFSVWSLVGKFIKRSISSSVNRLVWNFFDSIWRSDKHFVWHPVGDPLWRFVNFHPSANNFVFGQHESTWLSYYDYLREVVGLREETEKAAGLIELAKHAGWWMPYDKVCFVSERHNFLSFDARGRLHSLSGPAVTYPDGWKLYVVHGVTVLSWMIEDKPLITVAKIESEKNAEVRRVMTEIYGHERYIRDSGAELVAKDELGELYRKRLEDDEPLVMVKVINSTPELDGSSKEYWLRVDPALRPLLSDGLLGNVQEMTARNAIASTFGKYGEEYIPARQT